MVGYLHEMQKQAQRMLDTFNYELSDEVVNKKLELQSIMSNILETDKYEQGLDISDFDICVERTDYDYCSETETTFQVPISKVFSCDGEVYVEDFDRNEYFLEDIRESVFTKIYDAVVELS